MTSTPAGSGGASATTCRNGHALVPGAAYCEQCGEPVISPGSSCTNGHPLAAGQRFCTVCGAPAMATAASWMCPNGHAVSGSGAYCTACGAPAGGQPPWSAPQAPYGAPWSPYGYPAAPPVAPTTNGMAIASLILGVLWLWGLGSVLALIFGYVGKRRIAESGGREQGRGMAIAGIVLGWLGVLGTVAVAAVIAFAAHAVHTVGSSYNDGYSYGQQVAHTQNSSGSADADCAAAPVPTGDSSSLFYDGCVAGWNSSVNS